MASYFFKLRRAPSCFFSHSARLEKKKNIPPVFVFVDAFAFALVVVRSLVVDPVGAGEGGAPASAVSLPIRFRPEARADLVDAWSWYEEQRPGLGDELAACVEAALAGAHRTVGPALYQSGAAGAVSNALMCIAFGVTSGSAIIP